MEKNGGTFPKSKKRKSGKAESVPEISESEIIQSVQSQSLEDEIKMRVQENNNARELNWNLRRLVEQGQRECEMLRQEILEESSAQRRALESPKPPAPGNSKEGLTAEMLQGLQSIMREFENIEQEESALTRQLELPSLEREAQTRSSLAEDMKAAYELELQEYLNRPPPQQTPLDTLLHHLRVEKDRLDKERIVKRRELERAWYFAPPSCVIPGTLQQKEQ